MTRSRSASEALISGHGPDPEGSPVGQKSADTSPPRAADGSALGAGTHTPGEPTLYRGTAIGQAQAPVCGRDHRNPIGALAIGFVVTLAFSRAAVRAEEAVPLATPAPAEA